MYFIKSRTDVPVLSSQTTNMHLFYFEACYGKNLSWGFRPLPTQTNRTTEDYKRLTSLDLQSRAIVFGSENKG